MENNRPVILVEIGNESLREHAGEVLLGIEEEGCPGEIHMSRDEISFSSANVSIGIEKERITLYVLEAGSAHMIYEVEAFESRDLRIMGMNGARYLKNRSLAACNLWHKYPQAAELSGCEA